MIRAISVDIMERYDTQKLQRKLGYNNDSLEDIMAFQLFLLTTKHTNDLIHMDHTYINEEGRQKHIFSGVMKGICRNFPQFRRIEVVACDMASDSFQRMWKAYQLHNSHHIFRMI